MLVIFIYFITFKIQNSRCQWPDHIDLKKLGEFEYNNEIYNLFKPSVHIVKTPGFYTIRRGNNLPKETFIDTNGLLHYWKSFKPNLRKSEGELQTSDEKNMLNEDETNDAIDNTIKNENDETADQLDGDIKSNDEILNDNIDATESPNDITTTTVTRARRPKRKRNVVEHKKDTVYIPNYLRKGTAKTVVQTTFYCPFLGIFTMKSLID